MQQINMYLHIDNPTCGTLDSTFLTSLVYQMVNTPASPHDDSTNGKMLWMFNKLQTMRV